MIHLSGVLKHRLKKVAKPHSERIVEDQKIKQKYPNLDAKGAIRLATALMRFSPILAN